MGYKKINNLYIEKIEFDKDGNAIITLPPGTERIQFQRNDKDGTVKDQQFEILVKEIRTVSSKVDSVDAKVDKITKRIDNLVEKNKLTE